MTVNDKVITELGYKASFSDDIKVDKKPIKQEEKVVYILNKPKNVISSASDDKGRITVVDLVESKYRLYPLGRLDYDSSGLILLSNDGDLMQKLIHPKYEIEKTYEVTVNGLVNQQDLDKLRSGITIEGYKCAPAKVKILRQNANKNTSFMEVIIHEGKNRQIRKMFKKLGYDVIKLHRIKEANIELGNLKSGEYRLLKPFELKQLKRILDGDNL